jgi:hypothetical protein
MAALRFIAMLLMLAAVISFGADATRAYTSATHSIWTPLATNWQALFPSSFEAARTRVTKSAHPLVWTWGLAPVLQPPAWVVFGSLGALFGYIGRHRRRVRLFVN